MMPKGVIIFVCYLKLVYTTPQFQDAMESFWKVSKPGDLLRSLDAITSSAYQSTQPIRTVTVEKNNILTKPSTNNSRLKRKTENESAESPYDYDKAYEKFIKKYFDDSVTDALSAKDSTETFDIKHGDPDTYSGEEVEPREDYDPISEESKKSGKVEKCRNITRGEQNCVICKSLRSGETSESCFYNKETKPEYYQFEKQNNYLKNRATPETNEDEIPAARLSYKTTFTQANKSNDTLPCFMNKIKNTICYYCQNSKGEHETKCYAEEITKSGNSKEQTGNRKKQNNSHQRTYKRNTP